MDCIPLHFRSFTAVRLTGVVCTIGPKCRGEAQLLAMMQAGMVIALMSFTSLY